MEIAVRNFRGAAVANVTVAPIALIAGRNRAGKSSILQAAAAALARDPTPLGTSKKTAAELIHDGKEAAQVVVASGNATAEVKWPQAEVATAGDNPPWASRIAAGLDFFTAYKPPQVMALLAEILNAAPVEADLYAALGGKADDATIKAIWSHIGEYGWDSAHKTARENGTKKKGAWEHITGEKYGSKKAETWLPQNYDLAWDDVEDVAATYAVEQARIAVEKAVGKGAVSEADLERLRLTAGGLSAAAQRVADAKIALTAAEAALSDAEAKRTALGDVEKEAPEVTCPHCNETSSLVFRDGAWSLAAVENIGNTQKLKERRIAIAQAEGALSKAKSALSTARHAVAHAETDRNDALNAEAAVKAAEEGLSKNADAIAAARAELAKAEAVAVATDQRRRAARLHRTILENAAIVAELAPDGLRQRKMAAAVQRFNKDAHILCAAAAWPTIVLSDDLEVTVGGRALSLCSASERYLARIVSQLVIARLDRSHVVVIDEADILDSAARNGLLSALEISTLPALVGMTINGARRAPDLAALGLGKTYWVENGRAEAVISEAAA
jgi:hypothetical protein